MIEEEDLFSGERQKQPKLGFIDKKQVKRAAKVVVPVIAVLAIAYLVYMGLFFAREVSISIVDLDGKSVYGKEVP